MAIKVIYSLDVYCCFPHPHHNQSGFSSSIVGFQNRLGLFNEILYVVRYLEPALQQTPGAA